MKAGICFLISSLCYPQSLEKSLAHSRCSANTCSMAECMNEGMNFQAGSSGLGPVLTFMGPHVVNLVSHVPTFSGC